MVAHRTGWVQGGAEPARTGIAYFMAACAPAGFVLADSIAKHLGDLLPVPQIVWGRYFFHILVLLALILPLGWRRVVFTRHPRHQFLRGACMLAATVSTYLAVQRLPLPDVYIIAFTAPVMVAIAGVVWLREVVSWATWAAIALCFLGALVVIRPGFAAFDIGYLYAFGMAGAFAAYQVLTRISHDQDPPLVGLFHAALVGAVASSLAAPAVWIAPTATQWLLLAGLGLIGALAQFCLISALASLPASTCAPFAYTQLIWSSLAGIAFFGTVPGLATLAGGLLVVAGNLLLIHQRRRSRHGATPTDRRTGQ